MQLSNQNILIISPERWGVNMLSKHHYAIALAKRNNTVFFLNPPSANPPGIKLEQTSNITIVDYSPFIPGINRIIFVFPFLFNFLLRNDIRRLFRIIPPPDIVWSFDPYRFQNLKFFGAKICIFHPVDFFNSSLDLYCAKFADIIFSVARPILLKYVKVNPFAFFVNHGVSENYLAPKIKEEQTGTVIRCGYVGNLLSPYIHHENMARIINSNSSVEFHFIGPYRKNNLGSEDDLQNPVHSLSKLPNVVFHGEMSPQKVAETIKFYDLFLICYDAEQAGNIASNNHKILEYLSTGKVVVSSRISNYDNTAVGLFEMVSSNKELPVRFDEVVKNLMLYNSKEQQDRRISLAQLNSYNHHIDTIEELINKNVKGGAL